MGRLVEGDGDDDRNHEQDDFAQRTGTHTGALPLRTNRNIDLVSNSASSTLKGASLYAVRVSFRAEFCPFLAFIWCRHGGLKMRVLMAAAAFLAAALGSAGAQERVLPQSPAQVQLSFAPVVSK